jgi:Ser/Thr protein kinase RdoA (MazF antagonist)
VSPAAAEPPAAGRPGKTDATAVGRLLREYHLRGLDPAGIRRLGGSVHGSSVSYKITADGDPPWIVRAYRVEGAVPAQFSGTEAETMADWVIGRAWTLSRLAEAGYPAPRPVRARSGELVGVAGPWLTWATTFADGPVLRPSLDELRALGSALGRLHTVPVDGPVGSRGASGTGGGAGAGELARAGSVSGADGVLGPDVASEAVGSDEVRGSAVAAGAGGGVRPGKAAWHPDAAVATTLARLDAVADRLPDDWRPMHEAFVRTTLAVQHWAGRLPTGLVHGDVWAGNAVAGPGGAVTLIDWETGGIGLPVLDLGNCLAECHLNADLPPDRPEAWLVQPDEQRIAAVAEGYRAHRVPTNAERELLANAARFGAAFVGAIHFEAALLEGASGPAMDARLARLRNRLDISDTVAEFALRHLPAPAR